MNQLVIYIDSLKGVDAFTFWSMTAIIGAGLLITYGTLFCIGVSTLITAIQNRLTNNKTASTTSNEVPKGEKNG